MRFSVPKWGQYGTLVLLVSLPLASFAFTCPSVAPVDESSLNVDTRLGLRFIRTLLGAFSLQVDVKEKKREIFSRYPHGDQIVMNKDYLNVVCQLLSEDKSLTNGQKLEKWDSYFHELNAPAVQVKIVTPQPTASLKAQSSATQHAPVVLHQVSASNQWNGTAKEFRERYLKPVPQVITEGNKWFVIAGSPSKESEADTMYTTAKATHPNIDFDIYAPYGSNKHYALMMGTWLSKEEARRLMNIANSEGLEPHPYLWHCSGSGYEC